VSMFSEGFRVTPTAAAEPNRELSGTEIRKGTGDTLRDLEHARRISVALMDGPGRMGLEAGFVERALRVAMAEIRELHKARLSREFCVCAAVKLDDGRIIRGHRHSDCVTTVARWQAAGEEVLNHLPIREDQQGFMTSRGRFVDRRLAMELQRAISDKAPKGHFLQGEELISEDLY
jgi:hypothetical protein